MSRPCRIIILIFAVALSINCTYAQHTGIGAYIGGGYISGDSPDIGSFTTNVFFDADYFGPNMFPRVSFMFAGAFNRIVPDSRKQYFPFMKGISLKGMMQQDYTGNFFIEEGFGIAYMNDRTFSTTNTWDPGITFSLSGGINLPDKYEPRIQLGAGAEYAFIFGGTFLKYFSVHLQAKYLL
jgi:hypothetical protein